MIIKHLLTTLVLALLVTTAGASQALAQQDDKQRAYDAWVIQRRAHVDELMQQHAERQARAAEREKEEARIQAMPINRLLNGYRFLIYVSVCYQVRQGWLVVWVNDVELKRAHDAAKAIEAQALKDDPSIDSDYVWQAARKDPVNSHVLEGVCRRALVQLINDSPKSAWTVEKP
jgi:hypothetical protein